MSKYEIKQADKDLFAVYQVLYSDADIEMWYDWSSRLDDTKFTDECYWITCDNIKIGGAIIINDRVMYPFLITPFVDRVVFWKALFSGCNDVSEIRGVLSEDVNILLSFGYRVDVTRQIMSCPTDPHIHAMLPQGYSLHHLDESIDRSKLASVILDGYSGGIDYAMFGAPTEREVIQDVDRLLQIYSPNNLSLFIMDEEEQKIAGVCIAGISETMPLGFAEIGEICVLPQYRGKRLGAFMLKHIRVSAHKYTPVVKLCVTVGNSAEKLYRDVGFHPGPRFTNMSKRMK